MFVGLNFGSIDIIIDRCESFDVQIARNKTKKFIRLKTNDLVIINIRNNLKGYLKVTNLFIVKFYNLSHQLK